MSNNVSEAADKAMTGSEDEINVRAGEGIGEGVGEGGREEKKEEEGGGEDKEDEEEEEEEDKGEGAQPTRQLSVRDTKPADWESWSKERQKTEWWAPRNAARKAKKTAKREQQQQQQQQQKQQQKQQKQQQKKAIETATKLANKAKEANKRAEEAAEKANKLGREETAEKAAAERTQGSMGTPTGPRFLPRQHQPYQQRPQGYPARYPQLGRGGPPSAEYRQALRASYAASNPVLAVPSPYDAPHQMQSSSSPYGTPHPPRPAALAPRAAPAAALPVVTAGAPPTTAPAQVGGNKGVQKSKSTKKEKKKAKKAEEKKSEGLEQALERARAEERKKMEEEKKEKKAKKAEDKKKEEEKRMEEEEKQKKQREKEEKSLAVERRFNLIKEQGERQERESVRSARLQAVNSLHKDAMAEWEARLATYYTERAAATSAGDTTRIARVEALLSRAREFRTLAANKERFFRELTRARYDATVAIADMAALPPQSAALVVGPAPVAPVAAADTRLTAPPPLAQIFLINAARRGAVEDDDDDDDDDRKKGQKGKKGKVDAGSMVLSQLTSELSRLGGNVINIAAAATPQQLLLSHEMDFDLPDEPEERQAAVRQDTDRRRRRREQIEYNALRGSVAPEDVSDNEAEPAQPNHRQMVVRAPPRMVDGVLFDVFSRMVSPSGQLIDAVGDLVDSDFYLIDPVTGQRKLDNRGQQVQGRRMQRQFN